MAKKKTVSSSPYFQPPETGPFKIYLAAGSLKEDGFLTMDENVEADYFAMMREYPWPVMDEVVDNLLCVNYFPKLPALERFTFLDECWRILKPTGQLTLNVPARGSNRAYMDPYYQYPPVVEDFFYFSNKEWRELNGYKHYPVSCDFDWTYGFSLDDEIRVRNEDLQRLAIKFLRNATDQMLVTLTKRG